MFTCTQVVFSALTSFTLSLFTLSVTR